MATEQVKTTVCTEAEGHRLEKWYRGLERSILLVRICISVAVSAAVTVAIVMGRADGSSVAALTVALTALPRPQRTVNHIVV